MEEPDGFRQFLDQHSTRLLRAGWLLTGNWASAEDLVQTAMAAAWSHWASIGVIDAQRVAYVNKVLFNTYLQSRRRRWRGELPTASLPEPAVSLDQFGSVDVHQSLLAALDVLARQQRAVVVLRYFVDLSEAETAQALGCSVGAVKSHASRALRRLRTVPGLDDLLTGGVM